MQTKVALVTGSSKGIGQGVAIRLGAEGYHTYVTYLTDKEGGEETVNKIKGAGGMASLIRLDVQDEEMVRSAFRKLKDDFGYLNVLISNAVRDFPKNIEKTTFDEWKIVTRTKIDGSFLCTKYALPLLKLGENANLIFMTSEDGVRPNPDYIAYCTGTAGIIAFMRAMAKYLGKYGIRTNAVSPGTTLTHLWDDLGGDDPEMWKSFAEGNPMGRVCTPEDVANTVMLLVQDPSRYLNGNIINVNGGSHL